MKRRAKQASVLFTAVASMAVWWFAGPAATPKVSAEDAAPAVASSQVERGKYLVSILGCSDCHTPLTMTDHGPAPDMKRFLSGHPAELKIAAAPAPAAMPWVMQGAATNTAFAGPWGVSFAINLTPDKVSGMGAWDEARFIKAMRTGKHFGEARPILPPMPWRAYSHMTDDDLKATWAYLQTIPPVQNEVPAALPPQH